MCRSSWVRGVRGVRRERRRPERFRNRSSGGGYRGGVRWRGLRCLWAGEANQSEAPYDRSAKKKSRKRVSNRITINSQYCSLFPSLGRGNCSSFVHSRRFLGVNWDRELLKRGPSEKKKKKTTHIYRIGTYASPVSLGRCFCAAVVWMDAPYRYELPGTC